MVHSTGCLVKQDSGPSTTGGAVQTLTPAYYNGTVYGASNLRAVAWNISDGRVLWERWLIHNTYSSPAISATIENTKVYIGGDSGSIHIIDGSTGNVLYSYHTVGIVASSPAVWNGKNVCRERRRLHLRI